MNEIWKKVEEYKNYSISTEGRVRNDKTGRLIRSHHDGCGYLQVPLSKNGKTKRFMVHRLVALAFIENPDSKPQVNHKNGIKEDNRVDNLEWMTISENVKHSYDCLGRNYTPSEETKQKCAKSHYKPVYCIEMNKTFNSVKDASKELNLNAGHLSAVARGDRKTCGGLHFAYVIEVS